MKYITAIIAICITNQLIALPPTINRLDVMNDEIQSDDSLAYLPDSVTGKRKQHLTTEDEAHIRTQMKPILVEVLSAGIYTQKEQHIADVKNAINALKYHLKRLGAQPISEEESIVNRAEHQLTKVLEEIAKPVVSTTKESNSEQADAHGMPAPVVIK